MTSDEAYSHLIKKIGLHRIRSCNDFGDFFLFVISPLDVGDNEDYYTGTVFPAVDKKTGDVFEYDVTTDVDALSNSKKVKVETLLDKKMSEL